MAIGVASVVKAHGAVSPIIDTSLILGCNQDSVWWRTMPRFNYDTGATTTWTGYSEKTGEICYAKMRGGYLIGVDSLMKKEDVENILNITLRNQVFVDKLNWTKDSLYYEWQWSQNHAHHKIGGCQ